MDWHPLCILKLFPSTHSRRSHQKNLLLTLLSEGASFSQPCPAPSGLAEHGGTSRADNDCLRVREHRGDPVAARTFHIHEVGVWVLNQALQLVLPLLVLGQRQQQLLGKRHLEISSCLPPLLMLLLDQLVANCTMCGWFLKVAQRCRFRVLGQTAC